MCAIWQLLSFREAGSGAQVAEGFTNRPGGKIKELQLAIVVCGTLSLFFCVKFP